MLVDLMVSRARRGEEMNLHRHAALSCLWSRLWNRLARLRHSG